LATSVTAAAIAGRFSSLMLGAPAHAEYNEASVQRRRLIRGATLVRTSLARPRHAPTAIANRCAGRV
jgi:hypothetical protein